MKNVLSLALVLSLGIAGTALAADARDVEIYGSTDFPTSGSPEAHEVFIVGLLQLHNFEFEDARVSFQAAQDLDPEFGMAYWGEALSYEHMLWNRFETEKSREVISRLGSTVAEREAMFPTEREKDYLRSIEILFAEGTQDERELNYSAALGEMYEKYPDDLDAAALYAVSLITTSHGGRDYGRYMRSGAITEDILAINPRHPGALHYAIHSYDDPVHAPLGLRAAQVYSEVAPSAVHALHMGSHIYFALGMWEEGLDRNVRSFQEAITRRPSEEMPYGNQAYHALTWVVYALTQLDRDEEAAEHVALIQAQMEQHEGTMHRQNFISGRATYLVDTQDWDHPLASVEVDYNGLAPYFVSTDQYVKGVLALNAGDMSAARTALAAIGGAEAVETRSRRAMVPRLLHLSLEGQIELESGNSARAIALMEEAAQLEASVSPEYGPAQPVQPTAELLADTYLAMGEAELARQNYELALKSSVGRERSTSGLNMATH
ncbi:MAG: hypothetical protein ACJ0SL_02290 [Candidatus Rariloculaceae bacterium]